MNREAGGFVNSAVSLQHYSQSCQFLSYRLFPAEQLKMLPVGTTLRHWSPIHGFMDFQELYQSNHGTAGNCETGLFVNSAVKVLNINSAIHKAAFHDFAWYNS